MTSYYNPCGYASRLRNYHVFRARLPVPLLTVEFSASGRFQLTGDDADIMVRIESGDTMWQKERLLNLGVAFLPDACRYVAWPDCDVILGRPDWPEAAVRALQRDVLVQLFDAPYDLPPSTLPEDIPDLEAHRRGVSAVQRIVGLGVPSDGLRHSSNVPRYGSNSFGLAWAARRELLEAHGLYEAGILGGGDRAVICAAFGVFDGIDASFSANAAQRKHYRRWAAPFHRDVRGGVGWVRGPVYHLWHGRPEDRGYRVRYRGFREFEFDPFVDLDGPPRSAWWWGSPKDAMHRYVDRYFRSRREDG